MFLCPAVLEEGDTGATIKATKGGLKEHRFPRGAAEEGSHRLAELEEVIGVEAGG